jgi:hypothetical protein
MDAVVQARELYSNSGPQWNYLMQTARARARARSQGPPPGFGLSFAAYRLFTLFDRRPLIRIQLPEISLEAFSGRVSCTLRPAACQA